MNYLGSNQIIFADEASSGQMVKGFRTNGEGTDSGQIVSANAGQIVRADSGQIVRADAGQ